MTLPPLLTYQFWTMPEPPPLQAWSAYLLLSVTAAMVIVGVVAATIRLRRLDKLTRRALGRASGLLVTMGLAGLLLYSFSYERIAYFSMRLGWVVWLVIVGIWAYGIVRYAIVDIPAARKVQAEKEKLEKWLPKSKK